MPTTTDIGNLALSRIGHNRFMTSYDDDTSNEADLIRLHYPICRDAVLRAHPWNFAIKRVDLASIDETIPFEFTYAFTLPTDCLKVLRTEWESQGIASEYRIEGRRLLCDNEACAIEYIAKITDTNQFDPNFVDVLAWAIAAEVAAPLINDSNAAMKARQEYERVLREARAVDAQEGTPRELIDAYSWVQARI